MRRGFPPFPVNNKMAESVDVRSEASGVILNLREIPATSGISFAGVSGCDFFPRSG